VVAEGITDYYARWFAAGRLISEKDFLTENAKAFQALQISRVWLVMNLEESSFDTWIKY